MDLSHLNDKLVVSLFANANADADAMSILLFNRQKKTKTLKLKESKESKILLPPRPPLLLPRLPLFPFNKNNQNCVELLGGRECLRQR